MQGIAPLVGQIQLESVGRSPRALSMYVFHNRPRSGSLYEPVDQRVWPLDTRWRRRLDTLPWPNRCVPEILGAHLRTLQSLIHEYLFISLCRACAESLASENASRLAAMQRADRNIDELLETLHTSFHRQRQGSIDEELFDVVAGFEAFSKSTR